MKAFPAARGWAPAVRRRTACWFAVGAAFLVGIHSSGGFSSPMTAAGNAEPWAGRAVHDERAIEIARKALDAVETGWALARYDAAPRVRASVNLRGTAPTPIGLTANIVVDRSERRYRFDTAGDVGPLTLVVEGNTALLFVPALGQYARATAGPLAPGSTFSRSLAGEIDAMRVRLRGDYDALVYRGEEAIDGANTHRIEDTPAPGVTATYWIDTASSLPRRIVLARPGRDLRIDFRYGQGPRPDRIEVLLRGTRYVEATIVPGYNGQGRISRIHAVAREAGGGEFTADVNFDWSPRVGADYYRFTPPAGAREVPFEQLVSGVAFAAAGKLGALLPLFTGWS